MTTQTMVFGLLAGWIGGWALSLVFAAAARATPRGRITKMAGGTLVVGPHYAVVRLVSWACFIALAVDALWHFAAWVTR